MPETTFQEVKEGGPAPANASLTPFAEPVKPAAEDFRVLNNQLSGPLPIVEALAPGEYLVNSAGQIVYKISRNFPTDLRADSAALAGTEKLKGPQAIGDQNSYRVWHRPDLRRRPQRLVTIRGSRYW